MNNRLYLKYGTNNSDELKPTEIIDKNLRISKSIEYTGQSQSLFTVFILSDHLQTLSLKEVPEIDDIEVKGKRGKGSALFTIGSTKNRKLFLAFYPPISDRLPLNIHRI